MLYLKGKRALVTGASRGIGRQIAVGLASIGCDLIIHASKKTNLEETLRLLKEYDVLVDCVTCDLANVDEVKEMLIELDEKYTNIDILYNNAAISCDPQPFFELDIELINKIMTVNVYSLITICNHFIEKMKKNGYGRIINFTSGIKDNPSLMPYAISKAAVDKYTKDMCVLLEDSDVLMNLITPGWVKTEMGGESATLEIEDVLPGVLFPSLLDANGGSGICYKVPDYVGMTIEEMINIKER